MSKIFTPSELTSNQAHVSSMESYQKIYQDSISDPESFWAEISQRLDWMEPWVSVRKFDFVNGQIIYVDGGILATIGKPFNE